MPTRMGFLRERVLEVATCAGAVGSRSRAVAGVAAGGKEEGSGLELGSQTGSLQFVQTFAVLEAAVRSAQSATRLIEFSRLMALILSEDFI